MIEKLTGLELRRIFEETGFGFSKSLGQNFLCDERILNLIADDACISKDQTVLEIGTGAGTLTRVLAKRAQKVVSVEVDKTLLPVHEKTLDGFENVKVINADFLSLDIKKFFEEELEENFAVAANLPYYITTPIIMSLLESGVKFKSITVLVQKEVAQRMAAKENTAEYGALTCAVQFYTKTTLCSKIPASCFYPAPKVSSQVIRLERLEEPRVKVQDQKTFFACVKSAFAMRRKTLANNLMASFAFSRTEAEEIIEKASLPKTVRGEALSLDELARVSDLIYFKKNNKE
ncbi:MAG: 16S rRNA (adenine(1518)-N(6)/adenine(1519)-N(6))-dimethyltransferase RsmA [Clostridia bacterium]|nr:16S rRNA (adenine(1518)-N(6)/adenine(1519)-N(6))-dimethyltransferase RsmA [Clostridia bacterium]